MHCNKSFSGASCDSNMSGRFLTTPGQAGLVVCAGGLVGALLQEECKQCIARYPVSREDYCVLLSSLFPVVNSSLNCLVCLLHGSVESTF